MKTPDAPPARPTADLVSQAPANGMPRAGVTSFSREYLEYWAHLLQDDGRAER